MHIVTYMQDTVCSCMPVQSTIISLIYVFNTVSYWEFLPFGWPPQQHCQLTLFQHSVSVYSITHLPVFPVHIYFVNALNWWFPASIFLSPSVISHLTKLSFNFYLKFRTSQYTRFHLFNYFSNSLTEILIHTSTFSAFYTYVAHLH